MPAAIVLGSHTDSGLEGVRLIGAGGRNGRARLERPLPKRKRDRSAAAPGVCHACGYGPRLAHR
jgi:hypothetical protein